MKYSKTSAENSNKKTVQVKKKSYICKIETKLTF
jgi:hypothetical protein